MERAKTLVDKLVEQCKNGSDAATLLLTTQLLQAELSRLIKPAPGKPASGKVAVVMPSFTTTVGTAETTASGIPSVPEEPKEIWSLDPVLEVPTLAHQDEFKELNEKIGQLNGESLNDRLKTNHAEIASFLTETPVRDLKKAISINDRMVFLNELFRGDVDMYERSIKTINNFRILAEAEYWIERELKIKLGWDERTEAVQQFNQLIKRRFS